MSWYDRFAGVYDQSVEWIYRRYRDRAVSALGLAPGDAVLDLACGTGPNLPRLAAGVGDTGWVVGVDASEGMLRRARARAAREGLGRVRTLCRDARFLDGDALAEAVGGPLSLQGVLVTLGLSVIPEWEAVVAQVYGLLDPGGRFVVFDVHAERRVPMSPIVEWMAEAELGRRTWPAFEALGAEVAWEYLPGSPHLHGGRPYLLTARRPEAPQDAASGK